MRASIIHSHRSTDLYKSYLLHPGITLKKIARKAMLPVAHEVARKLYKTNLESLSFNSSRSEDNVVQNLNEHGIHTAPFAQLFGSELFNSLSQQLAVPLQTLERQYNSLSAQQRNNIDYLSLNGDHYISNNNSALSRAMAEVTKLGLNDRFLDIFSEHFGGRKVWYDGAELRLIIPRGRPGANTNFHIDAQSALFNGDERRGVGKIIILLTPVRSVNDAPFTYFSLADSREILRTKPNLQAIKITKQDVLGKEACHVFGESYETMLINTAGLVHAQGELAANSEPRITLTFTYAAENPSPLYMGYSNLRPHKRKALAQEVPDNRQKSALLWTNSIKPPLRWLPPVSYWEDLSVKRT